MTQQPITEDDLHAFIDEALDMSRRAAVEAYLARHDDVRRRVEGWRDDRMALRAALRPIAEEPVPAELDPSRLATRSFKSRSIRWATAAGILLFASGNATGWMMHERTAAQPVDIASLAQDAMAAYAVYGPDHIRPVELQADQAPLLTDWIDKRLNAQIALPDLSAAGFRFMGGRVVATPLGPAGMLMYDDDHGTRLVMLVRRMAKDTTTHMSEHRKGDVTGYVWADSGLGYSLVGATLANVLHPLADEVRRQARPL